MSQQTKEVVGVLAFVLVLAFILAVMYGISGTSVCAFRPIDANANISECK